MHESQIWPPATSLAERPYVCKTLFVYLHGFSLSMPIGSLPSYVCMRSLNAVRMDTVRRSLKEAFLASKIVILDYFSRELQF